MNNETHKISVKTANDFSEYLDHDMDKKLAPLNQLINGMKARLDQCQTVISISQENVDESTKALSTLTQYNDQLNELCSKIDTVEKVVDHIRSNLSNLEDEVVKAEQKLGLNNDNLVANILNPLLFDEAIVRFFQKKIVEKKTVPSDMPPFDRNEYFIVEKYDDDAL